MTKVIIAVAIALSALGTAIIDWGAYQAIHRQPIAA
jgi:hypothetical protein